MIDLGRRNRKSFHGHLMRQSLWIHWSHTYGLQAFYQLLSTFHRLLVLPLLLPLMEFPSVRMRTSAVAGVM